MGKLGYCILMLGTGATSGGGPMTCALSIDGVLYKQENESMEIQSMDFIVPPYWPDCCALWVLSGQKRWYDGRNLVTFSRVCYA